MYQLGIIGLIRVTARYGPDIIGSVDDMCMCNYCKLMVTSCMMEGLKRDYVAYGY